MASLTYVGKNVFSTTITLRDFASVMRCLTKVSLNLWSTVAFLSVPSSTFDPAQIEVPRLAIVVGPKTSSGFRLARVSYLPDPRTGTSLQYMLMILRRSGHTL
jgi:hypothetical protein